MNYTINHKFLLWSWVVDGEKRGLALTKAGAKAAAQKWIALNKPKITAGAYDDPFH